MTDILTESTQPKYLQIKETLTEEISKGVYKIGDKIPSENILPKRFDVSKMTVVKAIDEMVREGLLERVRGSGTYVSKNSNRRTLNVGVFGDNLWIFDEFERQNPNIKLNRINYTHENIIEVEENNEIDVFYLTDYAFGFFKAEKKLLDLTEVLEKEIFEEKIFFEKALNAFEYRRKQYAAPILFSPLVMFYNKNLFDQNEVPYPKQGWDNKSFLEKAKALTDVPDEDGVIKRFGFLISQYRNRWPVYVLQEGGCLMDESGSECMVGSTEVEAALKWVADLLHKHNVCPVYPYMNKTLSQQLFLDGKAAMIIESYYSLSSFMKNKNLNCGIAPLPKGKKDVTGLISDSLAISEKCNDVKTAAKLLRFALSEDIQARIKKMSRGIPSVKNVANSNENIPDSVSPEDYFMYLDVLPKAQKLHNVSKPELLDPFWGHADMVWARMESPTDACAAAEKEIKDLMKIEKRKK
jgi:multiple sugar transport system substrate-binding protein